MAETQVLSKVYILQGVILVEVFQWYHDLLSELKALFDSLMSALSWRLWLALAKALSISKRVCRGRTLPLWGRLWACLQTIDRFWPSTYVITLDMAFWAEGGTLPAELALRFPRRRRERECILFLLKSFDLCNIIAKSGRHSYFLNILQTARGSPCTRLSFYSNYLLFPQRLMFWPNGHCISFRLAWCCLSFEY